MIDVFAKQHLAVPRSANIFELSKFTSIKQATAGRLVGHILDVRIQVRLDKGQVDKAAKDESGRFGEDFAIKLQLYR